jgi:hypothetical protein
MDKLRMPYNHPRWLSGQELAELYGHLCSQNLEIL